MPTPSPVILCETATVLVATQYEPRVAPDLVAGVTVSVDYPAARVLLPGRGNEPAVLERVENASGVEGLFGAGDQDASGDGIDDRLAVGLISTSEPIPPGPLTRLRFDCVEGIARPTPIDFGCTADVTTLLGSDVEAGCGVVAIEYDPPGPPLPTPAPTATASATPPPSPGPSPTPMPTP
ncbi:MAG: hypothetical protein AB1689_15090 [Thermodesulfobacteriota bacterium]